MRNGCPPRQGNIHLGHGKGAEAGDSVDGHVDRVQLDVRQVMQPARQVSESEVRVLVSKDQNLGTAGATNDCACRGTKTCCACSVNALKLHSKLARS